MHTLSITSSAASPGRLSILRRRLAQAIARWRAQEQARQTVRALVQLDDRTLHDLGFHRSEAGAVAAELHGLRHPSLRRVFPAA